MPPLIITNDLRIPSIETPLGTGFPKTYEFQLAAFSNPPASYEYEQAAFSNPPTTYEYILAAFSNPPLAWAYLSGVSLVTPAQSFEYVEDNIDNLADQHSIEYETEGFDNVSDTYCWEYVEATNPMVFPSVRYDEVIRNNKFLTSVGYELVAKDDKFIATNEMAVIEKTQSPLNVWWYTGARR